jgi:sec-independent protein translocase protein TatA
MFEGLFQPMHLLVIFGIALLVFGPKKLPELGKGIGEGIRGFKAAIRDEEKPASKKIAATELDAVHQDGKTDTSNRLAGNQ